MDQKDFIPTRLKYKLPNGFSYQIGAKEISEALEDIPQYGFFVIKFYDRDIFWTSEYNRKIKEKKTIKVVEIDCHHSDWNWYSSKKNIEIQDPEWNFEVYALLSEYRNIVNNYMKEIVFPRINEWLNKIGDIDDLHKTRDGFKEFRLELSSGEILEKS